MDPAALVKAVSESAFFHAMDEEERVTLAHESKLVEHGEGEVLFEPPEPPSALYLVVDGVVEVCRRESPDGEPVRVAYLGEGATLAESKVVTGTPFSSLARFPEGGTTLQWPRPLILRKLYSSRDFSMHYLQNLARRLEGTFARLGGQSGSKLGGRLDHFDLPTILQTVVESGAGGVLEVTDATGGSFGSIAIASRRVGPIVCGSLAGAEAFFEILVSPPERGSFGFSPVAQRQPATNSYELHPLLFEAARLQDEYRRFCAEVPERMWLRTVEGTLEWSDAASHDVVESVWRSLGSRPDGWGPLAERLPFSRARVALAVRDMLQAGALAPDTGVPLIEDGPR